MTKPARIGGLLAALALASSQGAAARAPKRTALDPASLPGWVREAASRDVPKTSAPLAVLHDEEIVEPQALGVRTTARFAWKVLSPEGLERAEVCPAYYSRAFDTIERMASWTVLPDGAVWTPDPKRDVRDDPVVGNYPVADDGRRRELLAARVAVGAVVACETVKFDRLGGGAEAFTFGDVDLSTAFARFELRAPAGWTFEAVARRAEGIEIARNPSGFVATGKDLAPLEREMFRPAPAGLLPQVWARWTSPDGAHGFKDWDAAARWEDDLTADLPDDIGTVGAESARWKSADPAHFLEALERAFDFVARDVRYVAISLGLGGWKPHAPAFVAEKRFGDCKDKSFLLRAILRTWGVESYPVLVRTLALGPLEPRAPSPFQFDHVILAVPLPAGVGDDLWTAKDVAGLGRLVFVDGTDFVGTIRTMRSDVQGTTALIVHGGKGTLVALPVPPPSAAAVDRALAATLDATGAFTSGSLVERWTGMEAEDVRIALQAKSEDARRREWMERIQERVPGTEIAAVRFDGIDGVASDVRAEADLGAGRLGKRVDTLLVVQPGGIGRGVVGEILPPAPRRYPLAFGHPREEHVVVEVGVPEGWAPESLPPPVAVAGPLISGSASWTFASGTLTYERTSRLEVGTVPADRYGDFRGQLEPLQLADRTAVVFVRKGP